MVEVPSQNEMIRDEVCLAHLLPELGAICGEVRRINVNNG
jgi:hypothetical protein